MAADDREKSAETQLGAINADDAGFITALEDVGMPISDLDASNGHYFAIMDAEGQPVGFCGYETLNEETAFIRSCVVPVSFRGRGIGTAMMKALVGRLAAEGKSGLYLFTMDADPFFEKFGFKIISRDDAPDIVRATSQFSLEECNDAVLMRRQSAHSL